MARVAVRPARADDYDDVASFTGPDTTWPGRGVGDYLPEAFPEWVEGDGDDQRTLVAERGDRVVGVVQGAMLTAREGWAQGIRVDPDARGAGVGSALTGAVLDWARERGAEVVRNLVFDWNGAGMAQSRAAGFSPVGALRWAAVDPEAADPEADTDGPGGANARAVNDPGAAWQCWTASDARAATGGVGFDFDRSWAVAELTRERLGRAADAERVLAVPGAGGTRAMAYRARTFEREGARWAEYGAAAWAEGSADALLGAVAADAAAAGAEKARVAVPGTVRHASGAAAAGADPNEDALFVFGAEV